MACSGDGLEHGGIRLFPAVKRDDPVPAHQHAVGDLIDEVAQGCEVLRPGADGKRHRRRGVKGPLAGEPAPGGRPLQCGSAHAVHAEDQVERGTEERQG